MATMTLSEKLMAIVEKAAPEKARRRAGYLDKRAPKITETDVNEWRIESLTNRAKFYTVKKTEWGWGCSCPAWIYLKIDRRERSCKHTAIIQKARRARALAA